MIVVPMSLREANDFVEQFHRHNRRTSRDGGKFAIGASKGDGLIGVAIVGKPVARLLNDSFTAEVLRVCVMPDGPKNTCSFLYGRCWRIWQAVRVVKDSKYVYSEHQGRRRNDHGYTRRKDTRA
jgi:hypothetical protein